jgi:hypothetical protein
MSRSTTGNSVKCLKCGEIVVSGGTLLRWSVILKLGQSHDLIYIIVGCLGRLLRGSSFITPRF